MSEDDKLPPCPECGAPEGTRHLDNCPILLASIADLGPEDYDEEEDEVEELDFFDEADEADEPDEEDEDGEDIPDDFQL